MGDSLGHDPFQTPDGNILEKMLGVNPEPPRQIPKTTKSVGSGGGKRAAPAQAPEETVELLPAETGAEPEDDKPKAILRNPKWEAEDGKAKTMIPVFQPQYREGDVIRGGRGSWALLICALLAITFACASAAGGQARKADLQTLKASKVREDLEAAAVRVAASGDAAALDRLGQLLSDPAFLARLDDLGNPQSNTTNLSHVLEAMEKNPSKITGRISEFLARDSNFLSDPDRKMFLLPALAAVRPLSPTGEAVFRTANAEGYFNSTGPLLVANGSPRALTLFEEMIADSSKRAVDLVDLLHKSVLAHRTRGPVLATCLRLLARGLEPEVEAGIVETLFDYQEKRWFGVARSAPVPPPWNTAETRVLRSYLDAAKGLRGPGRLSDALQGAIEGTTFEIRDILAARAP